MTARKTLILCVAMLVGAALAPSSASAFKLVKVAGGAITKHTEIHFVAHPEFNSAGSGFKCELNGTITTKDGEETSTSVINLQLITNSCVSFGLYKGCVVNGDVVTPPGAISKIDSNALTFQLIIETTFAEAGGCIYSHTNLYFEPLRIAVGTGPITFGLIEGEGAGEFEGLKFEMMAAGEFTLGQYTEAGVNKGAAKNVFKIE